MFRDLEFPPKVVVETFVENFFFGVKCFELLGMICLSKLFLVFFLLEFANFQNCEFEFKNKSEVLFYGFLT